MKRILCTVLASLMLLLTAACSGGNGDENNSGQTNNQEQSTQQAENPVTLRWLMQVGSDEEAAQWRELAADVTSFYPNITVDLATTDWGGYWTKLPTEIAGGNPPDIFYMQMMRAQSYLTAGFEPLDSFIQNDPDMDIEDFYQGVVDGFKIDDKLYCLPYDFGPFMFFYNMDLFDKYDIDYPDENTTYEDYLKICESLSRDGNYGTAFSATLDRTISFMLSQGSGLFDESGKFVINNPAFAAAIQRQAELIKSGYAPKQTDTGNSNWDREQFYSGNIGMFLDGPWNLSNIKSKGDFKVGAAMVPKGTDVRTTPVAGSGFGISKDSKNKQEAYNAVAAITGKESLTKLAKWGRALPSRASVRDVYYEMHTDVPGLKEAIESSCAPDVGVPFITTKNWQEVYLTINQAFEAVYLGDYDAQRALDNAQSTIDGILGQ